MKTGIVAYGISLPKRRMKVEEVLNVWKNNPVGYIKNTMGVYERAVLNADEDGNTLAVEAIRSVERKCPEAMNTEGLFVGTCTNEYNSRPSSSLITEAAELPNTVKSADIQWATKSGTAAMDIAGAMVISGMCKTALAVAADTINRRTAPGDLTESYASAGAAAFLIGAENVIAEIDATASWAEDFSDSFRIDGERFIRSGARLGAIKEDVGLIHQSREALEAFYEKAGTKAEDYDYFVPQQGTVHQAKRLADTFGFTQEQTAHSIISAEIGDCGSASPLLALANVLDMAKPGEKILLMSYGFGAGTDVIGLTVTDAVTQMQGRDRSVAEIMADKLYVDYGTSAKFEYKFIKPDYALGAFL